MSFLLKIAGNNLVLPIGRLNQKKSWEGKSRRSVPFKLLCDGIAHRLSLIASFPAEVDRHGHGGLIVGADDHLLSELHNFHDHLWTHHQCSGLVALDYQP